MCDHCRHVKDTRPVSLFFHFGHFLKPKSTDKVGVCRECVDELLSKASTHDVSVGRYDIKSLRNAQHEFERV